MALDVENDETISAVKSKVRAKEGYPAVRLHNLKILYNGEQLSDDRTISDCSIEKESVLHLRLSVRSGLGQNFVEESTHSEISLPGTKRQRSSDCISHFHNENFGSVQYDGNHQEGHQDFMHISVETVSPFQVILFPACPSALLLLSCWSLLKHDAFIF